jgi:S-formylglutathione hydrolase FrmB
VRKLLILIWFLLACNITGSGATIDTVQIESRAMHKSIKNIVILPDSYTPVDSFPVVYMLHGAFGSYRDFITKIPAIAEFSDLYQFIIICPDGGHNSWYFDSPVDTNYKYETYISKELIEFIDQHFSTIKNRSGRAITGLSMGGHGAWYIAIRHALLFGAAGSMSGGMDIRPFKKDWDLPKRLGDYKKYSENWEKNTVINMLDSLKSANLQLIMDCGTDDFFCGVNQNLHEKLISLKIPHDYIERPGGHNWEYWGNAVKYQMYFFHQFFL